MANKNGNMKGTDSVKFAPKNPKSKIIKGKNLGR